MSFAGATYDEHRDGSRLRSQLARVRTLMTDQRWRTLGDIQQACGGSEAALSARLRDLRKARFGGYRIERRHLKNGLFAYRLLPPEPPSMGRLF